MMIPKGITEIEVYYDGHCGMCCTFHEWINRQQRAYEVVFIPYQSDQAELQFPGVTELDPASEMIVRTSCGEVYRGAEAWVLCLYSCSDHQAMAKRLSSRYLLPVAVRACGLLANNRHQLSKVFFKKKDRAVAADLHQMPDLTCKNGGCEV